MPVNMRWAYIIRLSVIPGVMKKYTSADVPMAMMMGAPTRSNPNSRTIKMMRELLMIHPPSRQLPALCWHRRYVTGACF